MKKIHSYSSVVLRAKKDARNWKWKFWPFLKENKTCEPKFDQTEMPSFWEELFQIGENMIANIVTTWKALDKKLKPDYCDALKEDIRAEKELAKLTKEKEDSFNEYKTAKDELNKFNPPSWDRKSELLVLFVLGISEFFINSVVFQLFGENNLRTNGTAAGLGVLIPFLAYALGYFLKQKQKSTMDKIWLVVIPASVLAALEVISEWRSVFFEGTGIAKFFNIPVTQSQFTLWFFIINIAFFIGATVVSYLASHPQGEVYKQARRNFRKTLKEFKEDEAEVKDAAERAEKSESRLEKVKHQRDKSHQKLRAEAMYVKETAEALMKSYKAENLRHRPDFPECFKKNHPVPEIPVTLTNLDWECEDINYKVDNEK
jgi:hypothetical protein